MQLCVKGCHSQKFQLRQGQPGAVGELRLVAVRRVQTYFGNLVILEKPSTQHMSVQSTAFRLEKYETASFIKAIQLCATHRYSRSFRLIQRRAGRVSILLSLRLLPPHTPDQSIVSKSEMPNCLLCQSNTATGARLHSQPLQ